MFDISKIEIVTLLKKLYDTTHMLNYFIVENYRGNQNIKYKQNVFDLIGINSIFGMGK